MAVSRFEPSNFPSHITVLNPHGSIFFAAKEQLCLIMEVADEIEVRVHVFANKNYSEKCSSASCTMTSLTVTNHCSVGSFLPGRRN